MAFQNNKMLGKSAAGKMKELRERETISEEYKWKTEDVFESDEEWERQLAELKNSAQELDIFNGKLHRSAEILLKCLQVRDNIEISLGKLSIYAHLKSDEDTRDDKYQAYRDQLSTLSVFINQKKSFILPEILKIPLSKIEQFLNKVPALWVYRHFLDDLFRSKRHVLNSEGEELLALSGDLGQVPYQIFSMFNNADIKFPKIKDEDAKGVELTKGNFSVFLQSWNRNVRKNAYSAMYRTYHNWLNTLASSLSGAIKRDIYYASARKYNTSLEAALDADNIPTSVYQNVIDAVNQNLEPMHKYIALRRKTLGLKKVKPWDLYVPLVGKFRWEVSYENAIQTLHHALRPLGQDYLAIMNNAFKTRWFDVFENRGKRSGAYSSAVFGIPHPYMLLNYQSRLDDLFTIAHELGHSMHSYFTMIHQPYIYSDYTIFVAEVASTLNEALLMDYLLKTTEEREKKIYLLNQYIDQIRGTMYIQAIFAEFEKTVHEKRESGEALTAEFFNKVTRDIYIRYYGPDFEMDGLYELNWCRIPHFYYNFYVYQYATGLAAATSIAQKILAGDIKARDAYLRFLKRGSEDYSINLLKDAGVDMTSPKPIEETARLFATLIDEMEGLIDNKK